MGARGPALCPPCPCGGWDAPPVPWQLSRRPGRLPRRSRVPLYEFSCPGCGPFEERRPFVRAAEAARCPTCGATAQRVLTPPYLRRLEAPVRRALEREERSRHEPEVVRRKVPSTGPRLQRTGGRPWTAGS